MDWGLGVEVVEEGRRGVASARGSEQRATVWGLNVSHERLSFPSIHHFNPPLVILA